MQLYSSHRIMIIFNLIVFLVSPMRSNGKVEKRNIPMENDHAQFLQSKLIGQ